MERRIRIQGVDYPVQAQLLAGTLWVHANGRTFTVDTRTGRKSRRAGGSSVAADRVTAPMPGKITKILLQVADQVVAGQAVLVMEAMKMEYTLKAGLDGEVEEILCEVGEQVILGKTLVKLKASVEK